MHWLRAILTVEEELSALSDVREVLRESTNWAVWAASFGTADELLATFAFDLLIVQVSSEGAHGIALIEQRRASHPQTPIIAIVDSAPLENLIRLYGATPVHRPLVGETFVETVAQAVGPPPQQRRWPRKVMEREIPAQVANVPAKIFDMSYGGVRVELPAPPPGDLPLLIDVLGVSVKAAPVWSRPISAGGSWWCGAALAATPRMARAWRTLVDALSD